MARTLTRLERLDDQHARAAMRAQMVMLLREYRVLAGSIIGWVLLGRWELGRSDQLTSAGELLGARVTAIGEQTVVPDAVKALGQNVDEEPADELARPRLASSQSGPKSRKISATSRAGRSTSAPGYFGVSGGCR